jgi:hypothetical protein
VTIEDELVRQRWFTRASGPRIPHYFSPELRIAVEILINWVTM